MILRNAAPDEPRLTGCLVVNGDHSLTVQSLRSFLAQRLPDYAIPADSFARIVAFAISQPEEVDINEILYRPTKQEF